jgi:hypothetical protein
MAVSITFDVEARQGKKVMGIDLGLRYGRGKCWNLIAILQRQLLCIHR